MRTSSSSARRWKASLRCGAFSSAKAPRCVRRSLQTSSPSSRRCSARPIARFCPRSWPTEILQSAAHGLADGIDGWLDDDFAFARPWGFDVATSDRPVLLLHGADDRFVPIAHGRWLAERVRGVEARLTGDEDGHLTLIARRIREVHEWLLAHI